MDLILDRFSAERLQHCARLRDLFPLGIMAAHVKEMVLALIDEEEKKRNENRCPNVMTPQSTPNGPGSATRPRARGCFDVKDFGYCRRGAPCKYDHSDEAIKALDNDPVYQKNKGGMRATATAAEPLMANGLEISKDNSVVRVRIENKILPDLAEKEGRIVVVPNQLKAAFDKLGCYAFESEDGVAAIKEGVETLMRQMDMAGIQKREFPMSALEQFQAAMAKQAAEAEAQREASKAAMAEQLQFKATTERALTMILDRLDGMKDEPARKEARKS